MNWTPEEIRDYHQIQSKGLSCLYDGKGIPENHPEEREEYLKKILEINASNECLIRNFSGKGDNASMLNILESMEISEHGLD